VSAAARVLLVAALGAGGCNNLLGVDDFHLRDGGGDDDDDGGGPADAGVDAPPNTVVGSARLHYQSATEETVVDQDLRDYIFAAYIPDDTEPTGFRVADGTGTADGTFTIPDVPEDTTYYLKVVAPAAAGTTFYVTDLHVVDLDRDVGGRPDTLPVTVAQPVELDLGNMQPWRLGDMLVTEVYNTSTEGWSLELAVDTPPLTNATSFTTMFDWGSTGFTYSYRLDGRPALIEMDKGDAVQFAHVRTVDAFDTFGRVQQVQTVVDLFDSAEIDMPGGELTQISGDFSPVVADQELRVVFNRAMFDAGYDARSALIGTSLAVYGNPVADRHIHTGIPLVGVFPNDWSRTSALASTVDLVYSDPLPEAWPRTYDLRYNRARFYKIPGATLTRQLGMGSTRITPFTTPVPAAPDVQPPANLQVGGAPAVAGGRRTFNGVAPVSVSWNPVSTASHYRVTVLRVYLDGTRTRSVAVAGLETRETSVDVPAEVFAGGEYFVFMLTAVRNGNTLAQGHLRREGYPYSDARVLSGMLRLSATCGDGAMQEGEACDPGATETAACDLDCSTPLCGDGLRNAAAGEACDSIFDTVECDEDCTLAICGDGWWNPNVEDCDDGNTNDDGNGCSATCKAISVCGDGTVQGQVEHCDDGNTVDEGNGCSIACKANNWCGDGILQGAIEVCDDGNVDDFDTCSSDCSGDCPPGQPNPGEPCGHLNNCTYGPTSCGCDGEAWGCW
jgi:cysteine-rich repeat protein